MMWVPFAIGAAKSIYDEMKSESADDAAKKAAAAKLAAMRQGAQQVQSYRQSITPQMLQGMQNQINAYGGAQNVLSQMYGGNGTMNQVASQAGHAARLFRGPLQPPGQAQMPPGAIGNSLLGQTPAPGPAINPGTPGGARAGSNPLGMQRGPTIGFGGEMPMPMDLARRKVF